MSKITIDHSKYIFLLPILIGLGIISGTVVTYLQIYDYQQQLSQSFKHEINGILEGIIDRKQSRLQTISNSVIGFFESSDNITPDEFALFSDRIFSSNPELANISIIEQNQTILYSFPQSDMIGENFDTLFPSHPTQINGMKTMNVEFPMNDFRRIIISVPFDYFISHDTIPSQYFKMILFSPLDNNVRLYEIFNNNGIIETNNVEFTQKELENIIEFNVKTHLFGHTIKKEYVLKYLIWDGALESNNTLSQLLLIIGIISSMVIPFLVYKTNNILRQKIRERSQILEQKNRELEQIKKSKDEFVTMIIHDLKNPIVPIMSFSDILLSNTLGDLTPKQMDRIKIIKSSAMSLQNLINDLLDSQKVELGKLYLNLSENNLSEIVQNTISKFKPEFDIKEITIETNIADNIQCVCDKTRIEQVISNMLLNSLDFVSEKMGKISISLKSDNRTAKITIKDNGIGIEKDQLDKLFVKFYQVTHNMTRKYGGTGLGLAVSHDIIILHGGRIWAESDGIRKGSTFFIELPLKDHDKANATKEK
ncbi:MAG: HAMP domain-containing histidine kinase [Nitrosarchaeum sp.]|nr:HAMP domain-containing histidine kinase [Nitrosarchaeum sp.]